MTVAGGVGNASSTQSDLDAAKAKLDRLTAQIGAQQDQLSGLKTELNALAGRIDVAQGRYEATQQAVMETRAQLDKALDRYRVLRDRLDRRARTAYMEGVAGSLDLILSAKSIADFSDRVEYVNAVTQQDADLAARVQNAANALKIRQRNLEELLSKQAAQLNVLHRQRDGLRARFAHYERLVNSLSDEKREIDGLVADLTEKLRQEALAAARAAAQAVARSTGSGPVDIGGNPFHVCPVDPPVAFSDSFGAPRYAGGYHPHAGNDLMASEGTPIRAPFDGVAEASPNGLGGNAVVVRGSEGYVYNAHLVSYGQLGSVGVGTVVGYVGNSGDAQGGAYHDHFEWHPNVIPANPYVSSYGYTVIGGAIDPYPYLLQVC